MELREPSNPPKVFECPVCFDLLLPPICQCYNGHLVCNNCIPKVKHCPVCRKDWPKERIRNLELENVARALKYPCPFRDDGCEEVLLLDDIASHKFDCQFAKQNFCSLLNLPVCRTDGKKRREGAKKRFCKEEVSTTEFIDHVIKKHGILGLNLDGSFHNGPSVQILQSGNLKAVKESKKVEWKPFYIVHGDNKFVLRTKINQDTISWTIVTVGSENLAKKFLATITITSCLRVPDGKSFQWKGPVTSIRSQESDTSSFSLPLDQLKDMSRTLSNADSEWELQIKLGMKSESSPCTSKDIPIIFSIATCAEPVVSNPNATETGAPEGAENNAEALDDWGGNNGTNDNEEYLLCDHCHGRLSLSNPVKQYYECAECVNFALCQSCIDRDVHSHHLFLRCPYVGILKNVAVTVTPRHYDTPEFRLTLIGEAMSNVAD